MLMHLSQAAAAKRNIEHSAYVRINTWLAMQHTSALESRGVNPWREAIELESRGQYRRARERSNDGFVRQDVQAFLLVDATALPRRRGQRLVDPTARDEGGDLQARARERRDGCGDLRGPRRRAACPFFEPGLEFTLGGHSVLRVLSLSRARCRDS